MKQVRRILIIGRQGSGKSTLARVLGEKINLPKLTIEPDSMGDGWGPFGYDLVKNEPSALKATGKKRVVFERYDKQFLSRISENVFNQVVTFDDVLFLLTDVVKYRELEQILGRARQTGNYVFFTIHGVSSIPAPFWNYFTDVFIFKTFDKPDRSAYKIPDFERISEAITEVNKSQNPRAYVYVKKDSV